MKAKFLLFPAIAIMTACTGSQQSNLPTQDNVEAQCDTIPTADILGQWYIENIFFNDSTYVRPAEEIPGSRQYVLFEPEGTYSVMTNCNHGAGSYTIDGNKITFQDAAWTEMACDNMSTEEAMRKILPLLSTVEIENDSVMRINSNSEPYLILLKAKEIK